MKEYHTISIRVPLPLYKRLTACLSDIKPVTTMSKLVLHLIEMSIEEYERKDYPKMEKVE